MRVICVRHGLAGNNLPHSGQRVGEHADLVDTGERQALALAHYLGEITTVRVVYTSPLPRAGQTALPIAAELGAQIIEDVRLCEIDKGKWEGLTVNEAVELENKIAHTRRATFRPPGGENWRDVGERMADFIEERRLSGDDDCVLVSHDHPIRMGIGFLLGKPLQEWEDMNVNNASVTALHYQDGAWRLDPKLQNFVPW